MTFIKSRELIPVGTRVVVTSAKQSAKRYLGMTGKVVEHGLPVAAFDHLVRLDQMGESRWFSKAEISLEEEVSADSSH